MTPAESALLRVSDETPFDQPVPPSKRRQKARIADLFCGAGGTSKGARDALAALGIDMELVAVNHWPIAIETHQKNHPEASHYCVNLDAARPEELVPGGRLDLLMASPECTHHSSARGGRPMNDQSRMSAWHVVRWATALRVKRLLIENVPEFIDWGPLNKSGRPVKSRKGEYFNAWLDALRGIGFNKIEVAVINCADYGDATTRKRLFIIARSDGKALNWPERTHSKSGRADLLGAGQEKWRSASEIIDWDLDGQSIFTRKKPLAPKTMARIASGIQKFWGPYAEPFLIVLRNHCDALGLDVPFPTITAGGKHLGLVEPVLKPFVLGQQSGSAPRGVDDPLPTIAGAGAISMTKPILVSVNGEAVTPFLAPYYGSGSGLSGKSVEEPFDTVTAKARFALVEPYIIGIDQQSAKSSEKSVSDPLSTVVTKARHALVQPFIVPQFGERKGQGPRSHGVDQPLPTVTSHGAGAVVLPVFEINGETFQLDIRFRMIQNHELARAMSFSDDEVDYEFTGTKTEVTKQIGNAVPVRTASALITALMVD